MEPITTEKKFHFLTDGGELGELTRSYDWSNTPVGPIELWPQSLKTTVGTILHSGFPMFLWWGNEMIQFYNDAYRPSLGKNGKHPKALGQRAVECWPEIWSIIYPLIEQVKLTGKSFFSEDQLVPIFRNGKIEDVYWTFSYTAVIDESDEIKGVLVTCTETTEKVQNLKALKESKEQIEFTIEAAELGTWDYNPATKKFATNDRLRHWFGLSNEAEIDLSLALAIIDEKDRQRVSEAMEAALQYSSGGKYDIEYTISNVSTKEKKIVRAKGRAWFNNDNIAYRFNGTLQDITSHRLAAKKTEESELQFRSLVEAAPLAIGVFVGKEKVISMANQTFLKLAGKSADIIGKPLAEAMPELRGQPFLKIQDEVLASGKKFEAFGREVYLMSDGELKLGYYNLSYTPLYDNQGEIYAILDIAMDVTEQVHANKLLELSRENLRNIIRQSPVAMGILKGADFIVEIANDKLLEIWGKKSDEVIDKPLFEGLPEVRGKGFDVLLGNVLKTGERFIAHELPVQLLRNGQLDTKYLNFVYEPFREEDGKVSGIMAVAFEVTEQFLARQKIEEIVIERTESLRRTNHELSQFAYITSHDLQEPARKIKTFTDMLTKTLGENVDERAKGFLRKIDKASTRMLRLIRDVLSISHLSIADQKFEEVDLNKVVAEVLTDFELLIEEKKCHVHVARLPTIQGSEVQLTQLFGNLVSNGLKFASPGRKLELAITYSIADHDSRPYHEIRITDNGIGFDQRHANPIFNIFHRLHGRAAYEGTGIGLALCRKVVENHNGQISATSAVGIGSTFIIQLPVIS